MQTHYSGRVATILGVLLFALYFIFPYFYKGDLHPNLKPGIDIAGGTKLIYEIKLPDDGQYRPDLSRDVMQALKKRVDPDGVKNLVWRPQGPTRLEIQMPLTSTSAESEKIRENYTKAQQQLQQTNVRIGDVIHAIEDIKNHDARRDEINRLAQTSESRGNLYGAMASAWDRIQAAREKKDAAAQASATIEYEKLKKQLNVTNIDVSELQSILDATKSVREAKLKQLREENKDFPSRIAAIDNFVTMHDAFKGVRGAIDDAAGLKRLLKGSGVLEFRIVARDAGPEIQTMAAQLKKDGPRPKAGDTLRWYEVARPEEFKTYNYPIQEYNGKMYILLDITPERSMINGPGIKPWALESAYREQLDGGKTVVGFKFNVQGGNYFGTLTGANKGQALAIVLDDKVISAPNINTQINQSGYIEAGDKGYTEEELNYLISTLNAGSLPAQLADEPISEQTIKPQLGEDNLRAGLLSCIIGLAVVAVFMIVYYHLAGVVATIAVVMNVLLILGAMAAIDATFTLPGIAGIVLTIGASVDANVLIFERLREEQHRGVSLRAAIRTAYDKAWSAILDANVTTIITAFILYWLGSEEVKGFGLTLLFGLVSSLFTALFVTKTIFMILIEKYGVSHLGSLPLSYPKWDKFLRPNIDWMAKARYFIATSVILTVLGLIAFFVKVKQREMFDIEFAGGTSVTFELKKPMELKKVRDKLDQFPGALPSLAVVQIGNDNLVYEAVTPNTDAPAVKEAVLSAFGENLHMELRSKFEHMDEKSDAAIESGAIVPITAEQPPTLNSFTPAHWQTYIGGAAIKLVNLDPPLSPKEIHSRIERQREASPTPIPYRDFEVVADGPEDKPTAAAMILIADQRLPYSQDAAKWQSELVDPTWKLVGEAVNKPPQLQRVQNFNAQVAGDTQKDAIMALLLSLAVIMAYIWLRFGNLTYGTACVVAMVHDTLLVLAAVGISHYIGNTFLGHWLLIEPFRVNLTLVAAILTIMSYSMIDTIVVFDRIRENRGKFGHLSRRIVNDSINQTLSRTLLTAGTTMSTVLVMYIVGGPGIHGFTFVMLVGILVGTYSSVAIATPILLLGRKATKERGFEVRPGGTSGTSPSPALQK